MRARGRHRRGRVTRWRTSALGILAIVATVAAAWALARWPAAYLLVYGAWLTPLAELGLLAVGHLAYRWRFREAKPGTFLYLIIQVTTAGREQARVTEIIKQIRGYGLAMPHEIWVVTEPGVPSDYPLADRVLVVPGNFRARSRKKARALEYSRRVRISMGFDRPEVKIIFNDDDVSLTKGYLERAFAADYDVCQGVIAPRTHYAVRPFGHFLASHADDIRTHACLVYCSVFQGILRRPLHVHGEGLVVTGAAESIVTWDWPVTASEDLVFGQRAVAARLRWGWFHEYAEVTSPWTLRDYLVQRRRWLWGDIHAVTHRGIMPASARLLVVGKYLVGLTVLLASAAGLYLRATGRVPATAGALDWAKLSTLSWLGVFFTCGWIGAGTAPSGDSRLLAGVVAVAMMPASLVLTFAAIVIPLIEGSPHSFSVIAKTRDRQDKRGS
jgi:Glycosyl transferase family group 2